MFQFKTKNVDINFKMLIFSAKYLQTRMHSSRMSTVRCSGRLWALRGVCPGGVGCVCPGGWGSAKGEGVSAQGVSAKSRSVSALGVLPRGCLPRGVCLPWGSLPKRGVCLGGLPKGVSVQLMSTQGCLPDTPPRDRMTDKCKNITLSQLRSGR